MNKQLYTDKTIIAFLNWKEIIRTTKQQYNYLWKYGFINHSYKIK